MRYLAVMPALCLLFLEKVLLQDEVASLPAGSDAVLSSPYVDSFSCEGQAYGYFADVENNCEVRQEGEMRDERELLYLCCCRFSTSAILSLTTRAELLSI